MICIDLGVIALLVALPVAVRLALAEGGANNSSTEKHGSCAICAAGMTRKGGCGWRVDVDRQWQWVEAECGVSALFGWLR